MMYQKMHSIDFWLTRHYLISHNFDYHYLYRLWKKKSFVSALTWKLQCMDLKILVLYDLYRHHQKTNFIQIFGGQYLLC